MRSTIASLCLVASVSLAISSSPTLAHAEPESVALSSSSPVVENANHIFNAIHSSMRQWGSSLHHNGMSFFLARIPARTELYHGRGDSDPVKGLDWLAFEPEHSLMFATSRGPGSRAPPGGGKDRGPPPGKDGNHEQHLDDHEAVGEYLHHERPSEHGPSFLRPHHQGDHEVSQQRPLATMDENENGEKHHISHDDEEGKNGKAIYRKAHETDDKIKQVRKHKKLDVEADEPPQRGAGDDSRPGFLHTYAMKQDLNVIYLDGESAAKSDKGTSDKEVYILSKQGDKDDDGSRDSELGRRPPAPSDEYARVIEMCNLAANEWEGRVDGFIRMEPGFELILCDFEKSAEPVRITRSGNNTHWGHANGDMSFMALLSAVGARYHGIGGERVTLDYDNIVTAFAMDIDLFLGGRSTLPRLNETTPQQRASLLAALTRVVMNKSLDGSRSFNWQSITDMIVTRYSDPIYEFAFDKSTYATKTAVDTYINLLMRPFIDYDNRNITLEISSCASHFLPRPPLPDSMPYTAILETQTHICTTFLTTLTNTSLSIDSARSSFQNLYTYLQWTSWKECRPSCKYGEVCFTAIWPFGDLESHLRPYCVNGSQGREGKGGESYWGGFRPH